MRFPKKPLPLKVEMDLAPLMDVVFLLLIFFMLTSAFVFQPGIKVHLPRSVTSEVVPQETRVITVSQGDLIYWGSQVVTLKELRSRLSTHPARQSPLLIRADRQASLGRVVKVWDLCRSLGISQVNLATHGTQESASR